MAHRSQLSGKQVEQVRSLNTQIAGLIGQNAVENNQLKPSDVYIDDDLCIHEKGTPTICIGPSALGVTKVVRSVFNSSVNGIGAANNLKPLGLGSTGRTQPISLNEKLAMDQAISNPAAGRQLPVPMTDSRWPASDGWVKMSQNINGVEIHYVRNTRTNAIDDFKFK